MRAILIVALVLLLVAAFALWWGAARWQSRTRALDDCIERARAPLNPAMFDRRELSDAPPPVQRFFAAVLTDGQPIVSAVRLSHAGTFNMGESGESWRPFTSTQRVTTRPPGFVWDGRVTMLPGISVRVHDAYITGEGLLHASLFGLVTMARADSTRALAEGELMRYFAEAAWYPTALLPSQGITWQALDERSARATLVDGRTTITLTFMFDDEGLVRRVRAEARGRTVGTSVVPTPWEGAWGKYGTRNGMRVPLEGEVAWLLPEGRRPYWRGRLTAIEYEFAAPVR
jgi:hypothetical protein